MRKPDGVVGRFPEQLSLAEQSALAGMTIALEIYTPETLPERRIAAIGDTAEACAAQLAAHGLDPRKYEFTVLKAPW